MRRAGWGLLWSAKDDDVTLPSELEISPHLTEYNFLFRTLYRLWHTFSTLGTSVGQPNMGHDSSGYA